MENNFIKLSVCVVYKESRNPMTVNVNTGELDYSDMHISGSITRHAKQHVTFAMYPGRMCSSGANGPDTLF
jgi:hypothetical protein